MAHSRMPAMPYDPTRHGPRRIVGPGFHAAVRACARAIPAGCLVTYGDIGTALGSSRVARQVGFALAALPPDTDVPWWRVVAAGGRIAGDEQRVRRQARRLAQEGIAVSAGRVVDFARRRHQLDLPRDEW